jgi:hypothetical protein
VVSHAIQYYAPLYQRLAQGDDNTVKVFFTWHDGRAIVEDRGCKRQVTWDIPLTEGYEFELVPNVSSNPGTHNLFGLNNPSLVDQLGDRMLRMSLEGLGCPTRTHCGRSTGRISQYCHIFVRGASFVAQGHSVAAGGLASGRPQARTFAAGWALTVGGIQKEAASARVSMEQPGIKQTTAQLLPQRRRIRVSHQF